MQVQGGRMQVSVDGCWVLNSLVFHKFERGRICYQVSSLHGDPSGFDLIDDALRTADLLRSQLADSKCTRSRGIKL